ncbi:MAG: peptidase E [Actinobacteria bacterium]|nr:peptidase E [Actinomycetota bacterium]MCA1721748.1 peptidase E [Actinomycetota bacterium]
MDILAIGGGGFTSDGRYGWTAGPLIEHALSLTGKQAPKVCGLFTATGDESGQIASWYAAWAGRRERASHVAVMPMPNVDDLRAHLLAQDAVYVGGGSVAGLMVLWRLHGLAAVFREAWEAGVVLLGVSAGSLCWHTGGTTDSYGPELRPWNDGLGLIPGSNCPHYDSEAGRRPLYQRLVREGTLQPGYAADDDVALHYVGTELHEAVSARTGASAWRVDADGETRVPTRELA